VFFAARERLAFGAIEFAFRSKTFRYEMDSAIERIFLFDSHLDMKKASPSKGWLFSYV
jgi:hypothetical protein